MFGGLGTFAAWVVVMALDPVRSPPAAAGWCSASPLYLLYRRSQGLPLTETVKVVTARRRSASRRSSTESIVVPFDEDTPFSEESSPRP